MSRDPGSHQTKPKQGTSNLGRIGSHQPQVREVDSPGENDAEDLKLVESAQKGDQSAWSTLIKRHQDRLYSTCLRMVRDRELAADLTQDSFVKIIQGIDTFDGRSKLTTWMTRVTMNVCLSKLRSEKLRRHTSLDAMTGGLDDTVTGGISGSGVGVQGTKAGDWGRERELGPGASVEIEEERRQVMRGLGALDPDQRAVLILCDCRGLSYEEMAEVLGVAVGTVKSRVFRARTALREAIESESRRAL